MGRANETSVCVCARKFQSNSLQNPKSHIISTYYVCDCVCVCVCVCVCARQRNKTKLLFSSYLMLNETKSKKMYDVFWLLGFCNELPWIFSSYL